MRLLLLALCATALMPLCVIAKDADQKDAKRAIKDIHETDDPRRREAKIARLADLTLSAETARDVRAYALELQRTPPKKLPELKDVHEGAREYLYEVRHGRTTYKNYALVDLPEGLSADKPAPLVIGLHSDLGTAWYELSGLRSCARAAAHPLRECILACPQALNRGATPEDPRDNPPGEKEYFGWGPKAQGVDTVLNLLDGLIRDFNIDRDRIYLTGIGMGGQACFDLVQLRPSQFAAICPRDATPSFHLPDVKEDKLGGLRAEGKLGEHTAEFPFAACFASTPVVWIHASGDKKYPTGWAHQARDAMKAAGATVDYREYEGFHGSSDTAFVATALADCLKAKRNPNPERVVLRNVLGDKNWRANDRCYWVRITEADRVGSSTDWNARARAGGLIKASIDHEKNMITIDSNEVAAIELLLHEDLVQMDRELIVIINAKQRTVQLASQRLAVIAETAAAFGHTGEAYSLSVTLELR